MMSMRTLAIAAGTLWCAAMLCAQAPVTLIQDTLYNSDGSRMNGDIIVTNPPFSTGSTFVSGNQRVFPVIDGAVSITLIPTDTSNPCVAYSVDIIANGQTSTAWWNVPTTAEKVSIDAITVMAPCTSGSNLSWASLTNGQWTGMTNSQWTSMTN
jgi:hypothetical protein